jgi:pimeloyl-ACP methyl ester carboxylesterase
MPELNPALPQNSTTVRAPKIPLGARLLRAGLATLSRVSPPLAARLAEEIFLSPKRHARPEHELESLATARAFSVTSADGDLRAWEWGSEGPRVLLVHGWEGRGTQLSTLVAPLVARGFRVVAFDMPAHGDSPGAIASFFHFARAVARMAEAIGPLHAIVAHSMGGASTAWALRTAPRPGRLVMVAPPSDIRDYTGGAATVLGLNEAATLELEARLGRRFGVSLSEVRAELVGPHMTTPLLVIHDENDREVPVRSGEAVAGAWPGAALVRTRGLGHRRILREPRVLEAVVTFVASETSIS